MYRPGKEQRTKRRQLGLFLSIVMGFSGMGFLAAAKKSRNMSFVFYGLLLLAGSYFISYLF